MLFKSEAVGDKIIVMDFIYTRCLTLCPVVSQVMLQVQDGLKGRLRDQVRMISVSVDPQTDTPKRLKSHAARLGAKSGWLWLTGEKSEIDRVLDGLGAYTPEFDEHPAMVLVGDARSGEWVRFYGLPSPDRILDKVVQLAAARRMKGATANGGGANAKVLAIAEKARRYFTDLPVVTQDGKEVRFFTDLMKDKIVLMSLFYTECLAMCPIVNNRMSNVQEILKDRMGRDIFFISVTLDPKTDTPAVLKDYAANYDAGDGWTFITGTPENMATIARKLGQVGDNIAVHKPGLVAGNVKQAYWKKIPPGVSDEILANLLINMSKGT